MIQKGEKQQHCLHTHCSLWSCLFIYLTISQWGQYTQVFSKPFWHSLASGDNRQSKGHRIKESFTEKGPKARRWKEVPGNSRIHLTCVAEPALTEVTGNSHPSPLRNNYFWEDTFNTIHTIFSVLPWSQMTGKDEEGYTGQSKTTSLLRPVKESRSETADSS